MRFAKIWEFKHPKRDVVVQFLGRCAYEEDNEKSPHALYLETMNERGTNGVVCLRYNTKEKQRSAFEEWLTDKQAEDFFIDLIAVTDKVTKWDKTK